MRRQVFRDEVPDRDRERGEGEGRLRRRLRLRLRREPGFMESPLFKNDLLTGLEPGRAGTPVS